MQQKWCIATKIILLEVNKGVQKNQNKVIFILLQQTKWQFPFFADFQTY